MDKKDVRSQIEKFIEQKDALKEAMNPTGYVDSLAQAKEIIGQSDSIERAIERAMNPLGSIEKVINPLRTETSEDFSQYQPPSPYSLSVNCPHCGKNIEIEPNMLKRTPS